MSVPSNLPGDALLGVLDGTAGWQARWGRTQDLTASPDVLRTLARDPDALIRAAALTHPAAPVDVLSAAATDPSHLVRAAVAGNPLTPTAALEVLATDDSIEVRDRVSTNPHAPDWAYRDSDNH